MDNPDVRGKKFVLVLTLWQFILIQIFLFHFLIFLKCLLLWGQIHKPSNKVKMPLVKVFSQNNSLLLFQQYIIVKKKLQFQYVLK